MTSTANELFEAAGARHDAARAEFWRTHLLPGASVDEQCQAQRAVKQSFASLVAAWKHALAVQEAP
jgi:hypothetical protein